MIGSWKWVLYIAVHLPKIIYAILPYDTRRPIWNVAHMVNDPSQVNQSLDEGANSIEFDITFDLSGNPRYTYHGIPCDCFRNCFRRQDFDTYLNYMRKLTTSDFPEYRKELVLLFMDMKLNGLTTAAKIRAGENIAVKLLDNYWMRGSSAAGAYILVSIPSVFHKEFIESFIRKLKSEKFSSYLKKIGFDISGNEGLDIIRHAYKSVKVDHIWQGDGITNCLPRKKTRLQEALTRRDKDRNTYISKVYWWTVDRASTMRIILNLGIDGVITNHPHRLTTVLNEEEFSKRFRLATSEDNPWEKYANEAENGLSAILKAPNENSANFSSNDEDLLYNS